MNSIIDFYDKFYKNLEKKYNYNNNWIGVLGKNYSEKKIISYKSYFQIWDKLLPNEYPFETNYNLYEKYFKYIDHERCANNGIALKIDNNNNKKNYFHLKLNKQFKFDEQDYIEGIKLFNYKKAVSVEFDNTTTEIKRYYYIDDSNIEKILKIFKVKEKCENVKYIEYTHNPSKIIIIYKDPDYGFHSILKNVPFYIINDINITKNKCKVIPKFFGKNKDKRFAIYWDLNRDNNFYYNFFS